MVRALKPVNAATVLFALTACLAAGCSREQVMQPPVQESLVSRVTADGAVEMNCGGHELAQHTGQMRVLDENGQVLVCLEPRFHNHNFCKGLLRRLWA